VTVPFADLYSDNYEQHGLDATYTAPGGAAAVPCKVKVQYGGQIGVEHGDQEEAVIKVLWSAFPQQPSGVFTLIDTGEEWKISKACGVVDGHKEGLQRALLCVRNRRFAVKR
jgi:hypothetical protein